MIFDALKNDQEVEDSCFDKIYPPEISKLAKYHWTPVEVAKMAAEYLVESSGDKVLDIGSGVGKFCLVGAACTKGMFYGVEQRESLVAISNQVAQKHQIQNVKFVHANIKQISLADYDSFYFYNSFHENIETTNPIDNLIPASKELYYSYTDYLRREFDKLPVGTRIASYWGGWEEIPDSFDLEFTACDGFLNFLKKIV
ncbi:MAG: methyltransferase domain-containing protein [Sphingobacterium sp.]